MPGGCGGDIPYKKINELQNRFRNIPGSLIRMAKKHQEKVGKSRKSEKGKYRNEVQEIEKVGNIK